MPCSSPLYQKSNVLFSYQAGEDRFLNSLAVSGDGARCVCGDEVSRPTPLLVWDLRHRKLAHDLRVAGHEFLPSIADITEDGQYFVTACKVCALFSHENNFRAETCCPAGRVARSPERDSGPSCFGSFVLPNVVTLRLTALDFALCRRWTLTTQASWWCTIWRAVLCSRSGSLSGTRQRCASRRAPDSSCPRSRTGTSSSGTSSGEPSSRHFCPQLAPMQNMKFLARISPQKWTHLCLIHDVLHWFSGTSESDNFFSASLSFLVFAQIPSIEALFLFYTRKRVWRIPDSEVKSLHAHDEL